jgi:succinate dehydrogenase/fumarate reductase flavoprotein subunit
MVIFNAFFSDQIYSGAFATGDGVKMAVAMGADVVGLDYVQVSFLVQFC